MSDLKFDKRDLDMILDCLSDLQYESCKEAVADPYFEGVTGVAADIHGVMFIYKQKRERYIELYMAANPNQKDYFRCPKCKRILNVDLDWKFESEHKKEVFFCEDCGWTREKAPFEEVKEGGNQTE